MDPSWVRKVSWNVFHGFPSYRILSPSVISQVNWIYPSLQRFLMRGHARGSSWQVEPTWQGQSSSHLSNHSWFCNPTFQIQYRNMPEKAILGCGWMILPHALYNHLQPILQPRLKSRRSEVGIQVELRPYLERYHIYIYIIYYPLVN